MFVGFIRKFRCIFGFRKTDTILLNLLHLYKKFHHVLRKLKNPLKIETDKNYYKNKQNNKFCLLNTYTKNNDIKS